LGVRQDEDETVLMAGLFGVAHYAVHASPLIGDVGGAGRAGDQGKEQQEGKEASGLAVARARHLLHLIPL
jgi:hypothetical protein